MPPKKHRASKVAPPVESSSPAPDAGASSPPITEEDAIQAYHLAILSLADKDPSLNPPSSSSPAPEDQPIKKRRARKSYIPAYRPSHPLGAVHLIPLQSSSSTSSCRLTSSPNASTPGSTRHGYRNSSTLPPDSDSDEEDQLRASSVLIPLSPGTDDTEPFAMLGSSGQMGGVGMLQGTEMDTPTGKKGRGRPKKVGTPAKGKKGAAVVEDTTVGTPAKETPVRKQKKKGGKAVPEAAHPGGGDEDVEMRDAAEEQATPTTPATSATPATPASKRKKKEKKEKGPPAATPSATAASAQDVDMDRDATVAEAESTPATKEKKKSKARKSVAVGAEVESTPITPDAKAAESGKKEKKSGKEAKGPSWVVNTPEATA